MLLKKSHSNILFFRHFSALHYAGVNLPAPPSRSDVKDNFTSVGLNKRKEVVIHFGRIYRAGRIAKFALRMVKPCAVLTYSMYAPRVKLPAALLNELL
jgi:hypothetical protein